MKVDGACHCGQITFTAEVDPERTFVCHCTDCQVISGTAFRVVVRTPEENFELLTGAPKTYVKTAESGALRAQTFCGDCGTPLYATSVDDGPKQFGLRVGCLKQRDRLVPGRQFWTRSALAWLSRLAALPATDRQN